MNYEASSFIIFPFRRIYSVKHTTIYLSLALLLLYGKKEILRCTNYDSWERLTMGVTYQNFPFNGAAFCVYLYGFVRSHL